MYNTTYYCKSLATMHVHFFSIDLLLQLFFLESVPCVSGNFNGTLMFDAQKNHVDGASSIFRSAV